MTGRGPAAQLVDEWRAARRALRALEEAEHPDITDAFGRSWIWMDKDLYRHDSMAWPRDSVLSPAIRWPKPSVLSNPNERLCWVCRAGAVQAARGGAS